jgi:hypothetical protein
MYNNKTNTQTKLLPAKTLMIHQKKTIAFVIALVLTVSVSGLTYMNYLQNNQADAKKNYSNTKKILKTTPMSSVNSSTSSVVSKTSSNSKISVSTSSNNNSVSIKPSSIVATASSVIDTKVVSAAPIVSTNSNCSSQAKINLGIPTSPFLKQLKKYQDLCGSKVADKMMVFTQIPSSTNSVQPLANEIAAVLKEFSLYGITPVVIVEPIDGDTQLSFTEFINGVFNPVLDQYFTAIRNTGIADQQMGVWVPFPEANIPVWNSDGSTPADFGLLINNYSSSLKKYFPTTPVSVLMNYTSFDPADKGYSNPSISNYDQYLKNIKPGMVDSFGIQGFPWVEANRSSDNSVNDPAVFLQPANTIRAAKQLGVNTIWFNTGTISSKYTQSPTLRVNVSAADRQVINNNKLSIFDQVQNAGYNIWVNEFVQDKSNTAEQTNFSYLQTTQDQAAFKDFAKKLSDRGVSLSLFDSE